MATADYLSALTGLGGGGSGGGDGQGTQPLSSARSSAESGRVVVTVSPFNYGQLSLAAGMPSYYGGEDLTLATRMPQDFAGLGTNRVLRGQARGPTPYPRGQIEEPYSNFPSGYADAVYNPAGFVDVNPTYQGLTTGQLVALVAIVGLGALAAGKLL
jgi:hypothetical protein